MENLTLTSRHQLEELFKLQTYFAERNAAAEFPGLIEENSVTKMSFAARFASQDARMKDTKKQIQREDKKRIEEKLNEVRKARRKINEDRMTVARMKCNCGSKHCDQCSLQAKISDRRIAVYRSILMPEKYKLDALIFELRIPDVIACLRDLLYVFVAKHYNRTLANWTKCVKWIEHHDLHQFSIGCAKFVFLGTNCDYLNKKRTRDDGYSEHPDAPDENFIDHMTTDYNCLMCGNTTQTIKATKMPTNMKNQLIKKYVTFSVEESSVHRKLQWTLESTKHAQNKVLTSQCECPADLSPAEWVNFGSLRADGHQLQLRNLYRVLIDESLSFETPSVVALVMQTLWETGPGDTWYRECNEDFVCLNFVDAMINLLEEYVQRQQENWKNPLKLLVATLIVCRMFELNSDAAVAERLAKVLLKFRLTAIIWMQLIQTTIERDDSSTTHCDNLYANLVDVAICGIHTFFISRHHNEFEKIFEPTGEYSAVDAWLRFIVTANHNHLLCGKSPQVCFDLFFFASRITEYYFLFSLFVVV